LTAPLTRAEAGAQLGVSRETLDRLQVYLDLLARWQSRINLVGPATLADPWRRHILDCAQLWRFWPTGAQTLADLGSGAGLPGLVLAVMGAPTVHLIESDQRKAAFLREASRACGVAVTVHAQRSEAIPPLARARGIWTMSTAIAGSLSDPEGQILILNEIRLAASRPA
jgi:16S rRNA (guanine527-N7)-methyltransferase